MSETYANPQSLVSTDWLATHLDAPDVRVVDARWFMPAAGRDPHAEFRQGHIPGAVFFDLDKVSNHSTSLPHMLPDAESFSRSVGALGIGEGNRVIVYDETIGNSAAARVWWTFRVFGHEDIAVLDGGLGKWRQEHRPVDDLPTAPRERRFTAHFKPELVRSRDQMMANLQSKAEQVIDARSRGRFAGNDKEPWPHIKTGRIPGSRNLPWDELINPATRTIKPADEIRALFTAAGLDLAGPVVASCGSGVTASMLAFALFLIGNVAAVYDGSWAEWGLHPATPVEKG